MLLKTAGFQILKTSEVIALTVDLLSQFCFPKKQK